MAYTGSVEIIDGLIQKNNLNFPIVDGAAVRYDDQTRMTAKVAQIENKLYKIVVIPEGESLPSEGADNTFYLVKRASGKYDKWWYVENEDGYKVWDNFGGSSTSVVNVLPQTGDEDTDYILANNGEYKYYKWINNDWVMIAGSSIEINSIPDVIN